MLEWIDAHQAEAFGLAWLGASWEVALIMLFEGRYMEMAFVAVGGALLGAALLGVGVLIGALVAKKA